MNNWKNRISWESRLKCSTIKKAMNKCGLKYKGSWYRANRYPNDINIIKRYEIGGHTYRITTRLEYGRNGEVLGASKVIQKMQVHSWDNIDDLDVVDFKSSNDDRAVVWELVKIVKRADK